MSASLSSRLTTEGWTRLVLTATLIVAIGGAGLVLLTSRDTDGHADRLFFTIEPAVVNATALEGAILEQPLNMREYLLTGQPEQLDRYHRAAAEQHEREERLRARLGPGYDAEIDRVRERMRDWRDNAANPLIDEARAGLPPNRAMVIDADHRFRLAITALEDLRQRLGADRRAARDELVESRRLRDIGEYSIVAVIAVSMLLIALLMRTMVLRPLARLGEACEHVVAEDDFSRRIPVGGPRDIQGIGNAVESMRRRIVTELEAVRAGRRRLAEQADELRRSNAELERFAYVASHDLQEPLRKISAFCQLLQRRYAGRLDERADQYINFAVDGATRMQVLINDLLNFSRVGRVHDQRARVDLNEVVGRTVDDLTDTVERTGATVRVPALPVVWANRTLMGMLWQNLIGNALKFRREGVAPEVRVTVAPDPDGWLFEVADNGIGIAPEFAEKVFVIFQRLHGRGAYEGTGIGLALCRKIVERHGGRIWLEPGPGPGTRFRFTLSDHPLPDHPGPDDDPGSDHHDADPAGTDRTGSGPDDGRAGDRPKTGEDR